MASKNTATASSPEPVLPQAQPTEGALGAFFEFVGEGIETLSQVEAILDSYHTIEDHVDETTAARILMAAHTLVANELKRLTKAQMAAYRIGADPEAAA